MYLASYMGLIPTQGVPHIHRLGNYWGSGGEGTTASVEWSVASLLCVADYSNKAVIWAEYPPSPSLPFYYRAEGINDVKGSVCFVLKFALPPILPLWSANSKITEPFKE